jgi:hypothetical protein
MSIKNEVKIQEVVTFLNELLLVDDIATSALFSVRVPCNHDMRKHKSVQVGLLGKSFPIVGMIGILNGLFGADSDGWGKISAEYGDNGLITEFRLLDR